MKKLGLLVLVLVLALASLGIGYAAWSSSVTINGTVTMGDVEVGIADIGSDDTPTPDVYRGTISGTDYYAELSYDTTNAYPGEVISYKTQLGNLGSLPVKFQLVLPPTFANSNDVLDGATFSGSINGSGTYTGLDAINTALSALTATAPNGVVDLEFSVTLNPAMDQNQQNLDQTFHITVTGTLAP